MTQDANTPATAENEPNTVSQRVEDNGVGVTVIAIEQEGDTQENRWQLVITDDAGNMTGWEDDFANAEDAIAEGLAAVQQQGVSFFIGEVDINALLAEYEQQDNQN